MGDYNCEFNAIEMDNSLSTLRVIIVLDRLVEHRGKPESIWMDNGPDVISENLKVCCEERIIRLLFKKPRQQVRIILMNEEWINKKRIG